MNSIFNGTNISLYHAEISCVFREIIKVSQMHLPRESLRALFRGLTQPCLRIFQNILASFDRARYRDINTREHFQVHLNVLGVTAAPESGRNVSRAERRTALHARRRRAGRCALVFHRVTYLSIPRRTIEFNEVEIENTMERARAA